MAEGAPVLRVASLSASVLCLTLSFSGQPKWPIWLRWVLASAADAILAYIVWSIIRHG